MAMGTRKEREKQEDLWIANAELASAPGHPFYQRLNELLEAEVFDEFVEGRCAKFHAEKHGRPSCSGSIGCDHRSEVPSCCRAQYHKVSSTRLLTPIFL